MLLKTAYIGLTVVMLFLICIIGFKTITKTFKNTTVAKQKKRYLVFGLLVWQAYIFGIAISGVLETYTLPPRLPLFLIVPVFVFTGVFLFKNKDSAWIQNINPKHLIYIQSFRILVETLFVFTFSAGILHKNLTIEGYNMDMVFAFTAPIVGYLAFKQLPKKGVILWHYLGLAVLASVIVVFITSSYIPELYGSTVPLLSLEAIRYPYVLVAGALMPIAVFIHVLSIVQLTRKP